MTDFNSQTSSVGSAPTPEAFGAAPNPADVFRQIPQSAEDFGNVPLPAESFRSIPPTTSRKENHTLTVREVARQFETAGVARSERSIVNWCQRDARGVSRLDAYYDPNERRYFITPESVEWAIAEEQAKAARLNERAEKPETSAPVASAVNSTPKAGDSNSDGSELAKENLDLRITNRAKDMFIDQLKHEHEKLLHQLTSSSRRIGELETRLLSLGSASGNPE